MPASASDKPRRSRITAACAVCRAKRQKCSGEKPTCDQCRMHNEECWWSDQKKRGPAKDYLRSLQDRLQETEKLLLGLLEEVPDHTITEVLHRDLGNNGSGPSHQTWTGSMSGQDYWSRHPLNRLDSIREWHRQRLARDTRPLVEPPAQPEMTTSHERSSLGQNPPIPATVAMTPVVETISRDNGLVSPYPNGHQQSYAGMDYSDNSNWQPAQHTKGVMHERRYSEETRDVAAALFSISTQDSVSRRQTQHPHDQQVQSLRDESTQATDAPVAKMQSEVTSSLFW